MKKLSLSLLLAILTSTAIAADNAGDPCPQTGYRISQVGDKVLTCVDGKLRLTSYVGTTQITLVVRIMEGDELLTLGSVTALDGQPVPLGIGNEYSYIAKAEKEGGKVILTPGMVKDGFLITMTPTLTQDGKIAVEFVYSKSEVTSIQRFKQGDMEVRLPQVSTVDLKQNLVVESGKEIAIPYGPLVESVETDKPARTQYTLELVATVASHAGASRVIE